MAPEDAWRDPDEPGDDFARRRACGRAARGPRPAPRRARARARARGAAAPRPGPRGRGPRAPRAAPGDVAAAGGPSAAQRPDLADAVAAALDEAGREGRGATRALVAVFAKAAASS
ncbi:hypothetical protein JL720_15897 [Aureococcus anophagefferens]|nr:hypothetical protein JL720_15897 [Aureococcus anophagefferens]